MKKFKNRTVAAHLLAWHLQTYKNRDAVILAIPRGGIPIGKIVAEQLNLPLEVVLSKKIGHPFHKEYAIGAVSLESRILNDTTDVPQEYIENETTRIRQLLQKRYQMFHRGRKPISLVDKIVIIVDDGIATGNTILSSVQLVKNHNPKKIVLAIPVAPRNTVNKMKEQKAIDDVVCLKEPVHFRAVGQFYEDFRQIPDEEAIELLVAFDSSSLTKYRASN